MEIIITQWALDSYLDLKTNLIISHEEYIRIIRPDVLRLENFPNDPKFQQNKFWSVAQDQCGQIIPHGYKMKWHQIGNGHSQLRLTVGIFDDRSFLCEAYVKRNEKYEQRQLARFKTYLQLIQLERFTIRGRLS
jgi:hypothetical protein